MALVLSYSNTTRERHGEGVSESNLPPEQWRPYFDRADIEFGYRPLAARAGLTHTRVHRLIRGGGTTNEAIQQVADALGVKASKVRELRGEPPVEIEPFTLPDDAGRLNETERTVVRAMVRALLDARDNAHAADQPAADSPASTADTQDQARPDEKTIARMTETVLADASRIAREAASAAPPERIVLSKTAVVAALQAHADRIRGRTPSSAGRAAFEFARTVLLPFGNGRDLAAAATEIENTVDWGTYDPSEGFAFELFGPITLEVEAFQSELEAIQEIVAELRSATDAASESSQDGRLAPRKGKPHELRGTQDPFDDPNSEGVEWPDGTVVTDEEKSGYLQWLAARQPADFEPYRAGERNDYDLAARKNDERKGSGDAGLDDGED